MVQTHRWTPNQTSACVACAYPPLTLTLCRITTVTRAFFFLRGSYIRGRRVRTSELLLCGIFLFVFLPIFTVLGTIDAIKNIITDWDANGPPFGCNTVPEGR